MVTTSSTGPYADAGLANYPASLIGTDANKGPWRQILESKYVDIFSPQFYRGIVETGNGFGELCGFEELQRWIPPNVEIRPIFKITRKTDTDTELQDRITEMSDKCKKGDFVDSQGHQMALWCQSDIRVYLWSAN